MSPAETLALAASGLFLLTGLVTGAWKYRRIMTSPDHRAPVYVDIAHRAALLYSFAALVIARFVELSPYSPAVRLAAAGVPLALFGVTIGTYIVLGYRNTTDNQFRERTHFTTWGMVVLITGEVGGFSVLFFGFLQSVL